MKETLCYVCVRLPDDRTYNYAVTKPEYDTQHKRWLFEFERVMRDTKIPKDVVLLQASQYHDSEVLNKRATIFGFPSHSFLGVDQEHVIALDPGELEKLKPLLEKASTA